MKLMKKKNETFERKHGVADEKERKMKMKFRSYFYVCGCSLAVFLSLAQKLTKAIHFFLTSELRDTSFALGTDCRHKNLVSLSLFTFVSHNYRVYVRQSAILPPFCTRAGVKKMAKLCENYKTKYEMSSSNLLTLSINGSV